MCESNFLQLTLNSYLKLDADVLFLRGEQDFTVRIFSSSLVKPTRSRVSFPPVSSWDEPDIFFSCFVIPRRFRSRFFLTPPEPSLDTLFSCPPMLEALPDFCNCDAPPTSSDTLMILCVLTIGVLCFVCNNVYYYKILIYMNYIRPSYLYIACVFLPLYIWYNCIRMYGDHLMHPRAAHRNEGKHIGLLMGPI